ncbi:MAG: FkbM family methyltransferase [Geminicoccaceae bacterium]
MRTVSKAKGTTSGMWARLLARTGRPFGKNARSAKRMTEASVSSSTPKRPTRTFRSFFAHTHTLGFDPAVCIDVGAAAGTETFYQAFPKALHIAFEPLPDFHDKLAERLKGLHHEIHHCALMEENGELEILRTEHNLFGSSMMHRREAGNPRLVKVPVRRLDDVMSRHDLSGQILLKTDCQGADLLVIKGGEATLNAADVVIMETSFFPFWGDHHPVFFEIVSYMNERGFVVYDILDGLFRPSDHALGQVDLVFVKKDGFLRRSNTW